MTNEDLIKKYKSLYREKTGQDLSDEEAFSQAMNLVTLVKVIYRPIQRVEGKDSLHFQ